jgi:hypothetical protein
MGGSDNDAYNCRCKVSAAEGHTHGCYAAMWKKLEEAYPDEQYEEKWERFADARTARRSKGFSGQVIDALTFTTQGYLISSTPRLPVISISAWTC